MIPMYKTLFQPDYNNLLQVLNNERPTRLPLYEHNIDEPFISKAIGQKLIIEDVALTELDDYFRTVINFWKDMTFDGVSYEALICPIFPGHGAIKGGIGPIQTREDFERFPWNEIPRMYWEKYTPRLEAIRRNLPPGMKAYGGCGYGIFEAAQDLVGYEYLCLMQCMDPELFADLFVRIGDLYAQLWSEMVRRYSDIFVFFRMGDDLGFRSNTLLDPDVIRQHIIPQYKRVISIVHSANKKFLLHSCGKIFSIMDDLIDAGIDAKHSNEDEIAPYNEWIEKYSSRIGLFGGIDLNVLILDTPEEIFRKVVENGTKFRATANGYGIGSGNSIPDYIPVDGFMAMVEAVNEIRGRELK